MHDASAWSQDTGQDDPGAAPEVDLTKPSIARVYDFVLGGKQHFEADRRAANGFINALPEAPQIAKDNRNFLRRGVRYLVAEAGIRQIVDIGSGLPTEGNVHEIAHAIDPSVRVVYVDIDPVVLAHGRALLGDNDTTAVITADLRDPESIFGDPAARRLIDPTQPFAILTAGILHHLSDDEDPYGVADALKQRLPVGGHLLVTNFLDDDEPRAQRLERGFIDGGLGTGRFRTWAEQRRFFGGLEMVEPGLVYANDWRPDELTPTGSPVHTLYAGGIGHRAV
ncbi:SAM-dependent methyltransferase [Pseudonocardia sp. H11422]|uniref:SAM-dependent methyltransferase n=1 Tax=Pseudonocardia sp. H11422 TaxID=2835866 RepID=UPI0027E35D22|nr:SAM-dependent methyltransferase [Pseudonocardia sp. H11422]